MELQDSEVNSVSFEASAIPADQYRRSSVIQVYEIDDPTPSSGCYYKLGCAIITLAVFIILTILLLRIFV